MLTSARARGEQHVGRLGDPRRVDAQHRDRRAVPRPLRDRAGAEQLDAVEQARVGAEGGLVRLRGVAVVVPQARDGHVPLVVVQARQRAAQRRQRVADRATEDPRVHRPLQQRHLDHAVDQPAQARRQRGDVDGRVGRVCDDDDVAGQLGVVLAQQRGQRGGAGLLLALHEQHHVHRRPAAEGP